MSRPSAATAAATRRLAALVLSLSLAGLLAAPPAAAQPAPLPGVGDVGQGRQWLGRLEPTPVGEGERLVVVARGTVGARPDREIGRLLVEGTAGGRLRAGADFRALGAGGVRIVLLDTVFFSTVVVHEVPEARDVDVVAPAGSASAAAAPGPPRRAAASGPPAEVEVLLDHFPGASGSGGVQVSLAHFSHPTTLTGAVVPSPAFDLHLGTQAEVVVGGQTFTASRIRFLARTPLPPPEAPSAILGRVDVFTDLPALAFGNESVAPGVLFGGVPVEPAEGVLGVDLDPARDAIAAVHLGQAGPNRADLVTGQAGGAAVSWDPADLAAGAVGSSTELAAIGLNTRGVEVRGIVVSTRTAAGWDLSFQPPGGLGDVPRTIEIDGLAVGEVAVPAPVGVFARAAEPPAGAAVFPVGVGDGAFYGFSWDRPTAIAVPGAGTFVGRRVRLLFPAPIGPLASAGVAAEGLPLLTLTGLVAPAEGAAGGGPCVATATTVCLAAGRFAVEATWRDRFGGSGDGIGQRLTADTGSFWFFDAANLELIVKVLDACAVNERFWVFAGGLTDVAVELTVTDTRSGIRRVYDNPLGRAFPPIQDTAAFATCGP